MDIDIETETDTDTDTDTDCIDVPSVNFSDLSESIETEIISETQHLSVGQEEDLLSEYAEQETARAEIEKKDFVVDEEPTDIEIIEDTIESENLTVEEDTVELENLTVEETIETITDKANTPETVQPKEKKSFFSRISSAVEKTTEAVKSSLGIEKIKTGLAKTRKTFSDNLKRVIGVGRKIDENLLNEIEELLITADIGVDTTEQIIDSLRKRVKKENWEKAEDLFQLLRDEIEGLMIASPSAQNDKLYELDASKKPYVILVIGVNGVGKTTTIGKLAYNYKNNGKDVIIGAADTFRAAANEQLEIWAQRANVDIVQQKQGADPAAVAFDTLKSAQAKQKDVVIIDTAGRLHNKAHLMAELEKITRVMKKVKADAPDEVYLILDATTGQNAIFQAKEFSKVAPLTGIILTKLDGTAKGGIIIPIANELKIPVRYVGVGEKIDDLQPFDAKAFVEGLFEEKEENDHLE
ncbi:Signal recognition particle receptor FtsY [bioreactor metagenome]|uniref:Signal recognition particle receptor FtsY n=1 Tax=bioreactor metagenome TaxID=1076179 RepID=A0A645CA72_9ZZZZ